jgi:hypothetical protein
MSLSTVTQTASTPARDEVRTLVNAMALLAANRCLSAGGATIGTTTTKAKSANTIVFTIDGVFKSKAATDDLWTLSGGVVPISSFQKYLLCLDASGTASVIQGVPAATAAAVVLPAPPQDRAIVGVLTVATDGVTTFTPGTTALSASGITDTYVDGFDGSLLKLVTL